MDSRHYLLYQNNYDYENAMGSFIQSQHSRFLSMYHSVSSIYGNSYINSYDHDSSSYVNMTPKKLYKTKKKNKPHWEDSYYKLYRSEDSYLDMEHSSYNHSDFITHLESMLSEDLKAIYDTVSPNASIDFENILKKYSDLFNYKNSGILCEARSWYSSMHEESLYTRQLSVDDQVIVKEQCEQFGNILINVSFDAQKCDLEAKPIDYMHHIDYSSLDTVDDDFLRSRSSSDQTSSCNSPCSRLEVPSYVKNLKKKTTFSFDPDDSDMKSDDSSSKRSFDTDLGNKSDASLGKECFVGMSTPINNKVKMFDSKSLTLSSSKSSKSSKEKTAEADLLDENTPESLRSKKQNVMQSNVHNKSYGPSPSSTGFVSHGSVPVQSALLDGRNKLECFRANPSSFTNSSLKDIIGYIVEFARDQHGSRFIQQRMEKSTTGIELEIVFKEIVSDNSVLFTLVTDVFGNYVVQKMLEFGTDKHRLYISQQLKGHVFNLTTQMYGCRVIQKAVECVKRDLQASMISELYGHVLTCVKDQNGNHVIQKCIEHVPAANLNFIIDEFTGRVFELSSHPYGCRVIQRLMEHCSSHQTKNLMMEIFDNLSDLVKDQYGNYVIQHILDKKNHQPFPSKIIEYVFENIFTLSSHKFASNVAEKCIHFSTKSQKEALVRVILRGNVTNGVDNLYLMMKDPFANYVVQKIVDSVTGDLKKQLLIKMKPHFLTLKKLTYGKHMINKVDRWFKETEPTCTYVKCDEDFPPLD